MVTEPKILVTCKQMQVELPRHQERIESLGYELLVPELKGQQFSSEELSDLIPGVVGFIAGDDELDEAFFKTAGDLKILVRWGIGMDSVDHRAAAAAEVVVRNTPGVFGAEVADMAFAYILNLARGINVIDESIRSGDWPKFEGFTLAGQTIGIVGFGAIGREVAARAAGFGMNVLAFDPFVSQDRVPTNVQLSTLEALLSSSRFTVLTCPLTPETNHLMDQKAFARMPSDSYLVNVSRGPVVDEEALIQVLETGGIAGAGLDVFEVEPLPQNSALRNFPNVVLGSHNGSNTREGVARASSKAVDFLLSELGH
ncbi:phosphoglycerate dehydrogenase [Arthrobacter sp. ISL-65]|uniref:phosphoglycerate dehydrogenase n=1 Tax=Arthrobacter sp. ISL-65 TaxID=2819112 RepID=UPI001BE783A2|nr:phosphoglycerate dehydrogenase [Arthrobacter sp. ISL-65]MBT2549624.1 phosphoglycerate dehydrogenase [Arthrobacter sp. ISL-65]